LTDPVPKFPGPELSGVMVAAEVCFTLPRMPRAAGMLRWVVTVLAALSVVGAVGSGWCTHMLWRLRSDAFTTDSGGVAVYRGCYELHINHYAGALATATQPGWYLLDLNLNVGEPVPRWTWLRFGVETNTSGGTSERSALFPTWLPALLLLSLTAYAWRGPLRRNARRRAGRCIRCNYDRRGLVDPANTACPECGLWVASWPG
jgi:hypothetical protein